MEARSFVKILAKQGMNFYVGVPDSLLKSFCAYLQDHVGPKNHIITANEGNAIGMAVGHYLATSTPAVVYMQNSGLGNAINPLTSLADKDVYQIPMLLVVGWRGEPGVKDEPQHIKQGRITPEQLSLLEIPYLIVDERSEEEQIVKWAVEQLKTTRAPVALLIRSGSFADYKSQTQCESESLTLLREQALSALLDLTAEGAIVATTGKTSRELFELRAKRSEAQRDFLTVGGMGHTASIALGIALAKPKKQVVCIDGDGSLLMHLGAMPIVGSLSPCNFIHVLLNNAAHESVGGQPTVAGLTDFKSLALASGYGHYAVASTESEIEEAWLSLVHKKCPCFLEIKVAIGSRVNLGRPDSTPQENKNNFMSWLIAQ